MVKSYRVVVVGGGLLDYSVSFLGQVIVIVISRPRSLTIARLHWAKLVFEGGTGVLVTDIWTTVIWTTVVWTTVLWTTVGWTTVVVLTEDLFMQAQQSPSSDSPRERGLNLIQSRHHLLILADVWHSLRGSTVWQVSWQPRDTWLGISVPGSSVMATGEAIKTSLCEFCE